jgi:predicted ester cyclase
MNIKEFAEKFIEAENQAFQQGNFDALEKLEDPNVVYHMGSLGDMVGHEAHKQDIIGTRQACSDVKQEWKYLTGEGNLFALSYKSNAKFIAEKPGLPIPVGKKIATDYLFLLRIKNNRIIEAWANGSINILD